MNIVDLSKSKKVNESYNENMDINKENAKQKEDRKNAIKELDLTEKEIILKGATENLEKECNNIIKTMVEFSKTVPNVVKKINSIADKLKLEEISKSIKIIADCSNLLEKNNKTQIQNFNAIMNNINKTTENNINAYSESVFEIKRKALEDIETIEKKFNWYIKVIGGILFITILTFGYFLYKNDQRLRTIENIVKVNNKKMIENEGELIEIKKYLIDINKNSISKSEKKKNNR